jgi:hypothetical protein
MEFTKIVMVSIIVIGVIAALSFSIGILFKSNKDEKQNAKDEALAKDDLTVDINSLIKRNNDRRDKSDPES